MFAGGASGPMVDFVHLLRRGNRTAFRRNLFVLGGRIQTEQYYIGNMLTFQLFMWCLQPNKTTETWTFHVFPVFQRSLAWMGRQAPRQIWRFGFRLLMGISLPYLTGTKLQRETGWFAWRHFWWLFSFFGGSTTEETKSKKNDFVCFRSLAGVWFGWGGSASI